jgi:hypothetical protein
MSFAVASSVCLFIAVNPPDWLEKSISGFDMGSGRYFRNNRFHVHLKQVKYKDVQEQDKSLNPDCRSPENLPQLVLPFTHKFG